MKIFECGNVQILHIAIYYHAYDIFLATPQPIAKFAIVRYNISK